MQVSYFEKLKLLKSFKLFTCGNVGAKKPLLTLFRMGYLLRDFFCVNDVV